MSEEKLQKRRNWKRWFLVLLGIDAAVILILLFLIFIPSWSNPSLDWEELEQVPGAEFTVTSSKENVNELVNAYIDQMFQDTTGKYEVSLEDDVQFTGTLRAFSTDIPFSIRLEPIVQENGDLVLKQKDISLGLLYLPNRKVLEYLNKSYPTPDWVVVNPDKEQIYIAITQMDIKSNFKVKAEKFDLKNDDISFRIKVPNETLGL
ncbi:YpmS family protein [Virgibacillus senegalensis]|uniref:YpmS family protein n=1 Tax=Virgibacillus senegalensis TaxID=1499679 RepID=UPI00069F6956|nr:YpmS family protein [Virgibacillus senegalensis]